MVDLMLFAILVAFAALLGGSSRYDMVQMPPLVLASWGMLAILVAFAKGGQTPRFLLWVGIAYATWLAITLVPLPHGLWSALPGRGDILALEDLLGIAPARPVSLDPERTLNALALIAVPIAALLATGRLGPSAPRIVLTAIVAVSLVSALLAVVQQSTGELYLYSITNVGKPVGLFANTNHHAVFQAMGFACAVWLFHDQRLWARGAAGFAAALLLLSAITGSSRAGFLCLLIALAYAAWTALSALGRRDGTRRSRSRKASPEAAGHGIAPKKLALVIGAATILLAGLFLFLSARLPVMERLTGTDPLDDMRFAVLPDVLAMARDFLPFGVGIGAFEGAYLAYEDEATLQVEYLNMAHNDWAQLLAEGSLVVAGLLALLLVAAWRRLRARLAPADGAGTQTDRSLCVLIGTLILILMVGSFFDYPLRTPLHQLAAMMILALLWLPPPPRLPSPR